MKNLRFVTRIFLVIGLSMMSIHASAYGKGYGRYNRASVNHFFTVGASVGYSNFIENYPDLQTTGSAAAAVTLGYEMRVNHFYFTTGVEAQWLNANAEYNVERFDMSIRDTKGDLAIMYYDFDPIKEHQSVCHIQVPLIFGFYQRGFYAGAGAKVGFPVVSSIEQELSYKTSGSYREYIDNFEGMDKHGYGDYTTNARVELDTHIKLSLAAEIGYDVLAPYRRANSGTRHGLRVAAVCEYGLNNVFGTDKTSDMFEVSSENANVVTAKPYYQTHSISGHIVNGLYAGVKLTWICDFSRVPCDCDD